MSLITQEELEARLGRTLTTEEVSSFTIINTALQRTVEEIIGSGVEAASTTTRYFDGGVQHLRINPCTDITSVEYVDDDQVSSLVLDTTDYTKEPINKTLKTMLRHRSGPFVTGMNNISITAKFSINADAPTLDMIKNSMLDALVAEIQSSSNIKKESIEGYSVEYATTETKNALSVIQLLFPEII